MPPARDVVLGRIRAALRDAPPLPSVPRDYRHEGIRSHDEVVALFVERVEEYGASVVEPSALAALLSGKRIGVPPDLAPSLRPAGVTLVEDGALDVPVLGELDGALTTCLAACAETGTIALTGGPGEGRRALTLVPDLHVCVVSRGTVVESVPELLAALEPAAREGRPIVLVSGPSATSDIELERVEGVHGPRRLVIVLA